jgi:hypothetical protein
MASLMNNDPLSPKPPYSVLHEVMDAYLDEPKFQSGVKKNGWKKEWKIFRHA